MSSATSALATVSMMSSQCSSLPNSRETMSCSEVAKVSNARADAACRSDMMAAVNTCGCLRRMRHPSPLIRALQSSLILLKSASSTATAR